MLRQIHDGVTGGLWGRSPSALRSMVRHLCAIDPLVSVLHARVGLHHEEGDRLGDGRAPHDHSLFIESTSPGRTFIRRAADDVLPEPDLDDVPELQSLGLAQVGRAAQPSQRATIRATKTSVVIGCQVRWNQLRLCASVSCCQSVNPTAFRRRRGALPRSTAGWPYRCQSRALHPRGTINPFRPPPRELGPVALPSSRSADLCWTGDGK
jgi:hypothetical protein